MSTHDNLFYVIAHRQIGCNIIITHTANGHTQADILRHRENIKRDIEKAHLMNANNLHGLINIVIREKHVQCV